MNKPSDWCEAHPLQAFELHKHAQGHSGLFCSSEFGYLFGSIDENKGQIQDYRELTTILWAH